MVGGYLFPSHLGKGPSNSVRVQRTEGTEGAHGYDGISPFMMDVNACSKQVVPVGDAIDRDIEHTIFESGRNDDLKSRM